MFRPLQSIRSEDPGVGTSLGLIKYIPLRGRLEVNP